MFSTDDVLHIRSICFVFTSNTSRIYIYAESSVVHTCFVSDKTIRVGVWTCGQRAPTYSPAHITLSVVEQNKEPFRGKPQRCY